MLILFMYRKCPDELKEAISSLIFAASKCGELPEMQKISRLFQSRFGKEFAARAVELRTNCGVNPKVWLDSSSSYLLIYTIPLNFQYFFFSRLQRNLQLDCQV